MKQKFDVTGMTCGACVAHVEKAVKKLPGVQDVAVSLMTNSMQVEYDDSTLNSDAISAAVSAAGYGAQPALQCPTATAAHETPQAQNQAELQQMKHRLLWSIVFLLPLFYISMGHMLGLPLPPFLVGHDNLLSFALTQLLLTLPILALNNKYYKGGFGRQIHQLFDGGGRFAAGAGFQEFAHSDQCEDHTGGLEIEAHMILLHQSGVAVAKAVGELIEDENAVGHGGGRADGH